MSNPSVAPLRNVTMFASLIEQVKTRDYGLPGMACFYGPSGFGKTTAATYAANLYDAVYVQMKSCWTAKKLCSTLVEEMGMAPARTIYDQVDQVAAEIARTQNPIMVDEADYLVDKKAIEILRDIYEATNAPMILIGEERLPQKLQQWERIHGRMLNWVAAEPACVADIAPLMAIYAPGLEISDSAKDKILAGAGGSLRRVCTALARIKETANQKNTMLIEPDDFEEGACFIPTTAPAPRRPKVA